MRESFLPFHRQSIGDEEIESVVRVLRSPWVTSGPEVDAFEKEFAAYVGAKHALAVNSCTAALHLALEAMGIGGGDEVLVPTMTFAASAETVLYLKARPVLVDIDPHSLLMDLRDAEAKISSKTKAIMPVHVAGLPSAMPAWIELAKVRNIQLVEDAAHAFPAKSSGRWIGSISNATCFSFYATKTITTGEGGMLTLNSDAHYRRAKRMRSHGLDRDVWSRSGSQDPWRYDIVSPGFKYNMTDIAGAMGRVQLRKAEEMRQKRQEIAAFYNAHFGNCEALECPASNQAAGDLHSWHLYTLRLRPEVLRIERDQFIRELKNRNIGASVHWIPLHLHTLYRERFGYTPEALPQATGISSRIFSLPIYPDMSERDRLDVVEAVHLILQTFKR